MAIPAETTYAGSYDFLIVALSIVIAAASSYAALDLGARVRRVSTTLRQVLTEFSELFNFHQEISRQDRLATTIADSVDPPHPHFFPPQGHFAFPK
jgi:hypothetical protein